MIQKGRSLSRRAIVGLGLAVWIILLIFATLRARADGPQWGVQLGATADGRTVVTGIDSQGMGCSLGLRPQDDLIAVDGDSAAAFLGQGGPTGAVQLTEIDANGALRM